MGCITRVGQVLGLLVLVWGLFWSDVAWASREFSPLQFVPRHAAWMVTLTQPLNKVSPQVRPLISEFFESQWDGLGLGRAGGSLLAWDAGLTLVNVSAIATETPETVWIIPIKDAAITEKALAKLWEKLEITPTTDTVSGLQVFTPGPAVKAPKIAIGMVGNNYLLVGSSVQAVQESFVAAQSVNNVLGANFYREADLKLTGDTWGLSYINLGGWNQEYGNGAVISPDRVFLAWANLKKPVPGLAIETTLISRKLSSQPPKPSTTTLNLSLAQALHDSPAVLFLGQNLPQTWAELNTVISGYGAGQKFIEQALQAWSRQFRIDLETEVGPWLTGDLALSVFPRSFETSTQPAWHWQLTTPTTPTLTAGLEALATTLEMQGWQKTPLESETMTAQSWSFAPDSPPQFVQAQSPTLTTFATEINDLTPTTATNSPLAWQPLLTRTYSPDTLIHLNWGDYHLAWVKTIPALKLLEISAPSVFEKLTGVTWLGLGQEGRVSRSAVILAWEK